MYIPSSNINKEKKNGFPVDVFGIDKKKSIEEVSKELRRKINYRIKKHKDVIPGVYSNSEIKEYEFPNN